MKRILITGAAGFIGFHLCKKLIQLNQFLVEGIDNLNAYYDVRLKLDRLQELGINTREESFLQHKKVTSKAYGNFIFQQLDIADAKLLEAFFRGKEYDVVINLAAQAGVRYSIENPSVYVQSNIVGFLNILENCKNSKVPHLVYASSSSVYGNQMEGPFREDDIVDKPVSTYAATKKSNELMAHVYSHLYGFRTTALRFFTVYGPWGRPDMAPFLFTRAILGGDKIDVFNNGDLYRDFTYIDDIVAGVIGVIHSEFSDVKELSSIFNIGNNAPVSLMDFISTLEKFCGRKADKNFLPMQPGDVYKTYADIDNLKQLVNYQPTTNLDAGLEKFVTWYKDYYGVK